MNSRDSVCLLSLKMKATIFGVEYLLPAVVKEEKLRHSVS